MCSKRFYVLLLLPFVGCAHSPPPVVALPASDEVVSGDRFTTEVYRQLAHERRHQSIGFHEEMLGVPSSGTVGCETDTP